VLEQIRDTSGLLCSTRSETAESFKVHAKAGGLGVHEQVKALRWMGYPMRLERLLEILDESDLDDTYKPKDQEEFLRLVSRIHRDEVLCMRSHLDGRPVRCNCDGAETQDAGRCRSCGHERSPCGTMSVNSAECSMTWAIQPA